MATSAPTGTALCTLLADWVSFKCKPVACCRPLVAVPAGLLVFTVPCMTHAHARVTLQSCMIDAILA